MAGSYGWLYYRPKLREYRGIVPCKFAVCRDVKFGVIDLARNTP